ncbi:hypothetical protein [Kribbella antiqua]|uniref:hypothetical protein n=1 Tax=Kribbella antiqua TaxID=2512217 RepID=UPI001305159B|nr:hypothetical protein [Kribbella antiqua]
MEHGFDQGRAYGGPIRGAEGNDLCQTVLKDGLGDLIEMHDARALREPIDQLLRVHAKAGRLLQQALRCDEGSLVLRFGEDQPWVPGELGEDLEVLRCSKLGEALGEAK